MIPGTAISTAEIARAIGSGGAVLRGAILSLPPQLAKSSQGATISGVVSENLENGQVRIATAVGNVELGIGRAIPVGQQVSVRIHPWSESVTSSTNYPSAIPDRGNSKAGSAASAPATPGSSGHGWATGQVAPLSTAALTAVLEAANAGSTDKLVGKMAAALGDSADAAVVSSTQPNNQPASPFSEATTALLRRLSGGTDIGATIAAASFLAIARHQERKASIAEPSEPAESADQAGGQGSRMGAPVSGSADQGERPAPTATTTNIELTRMYVEELAGPLIAKVQREEVPRDTQDDDTDAAIGTRLVFELNLRNIGRADIEVLSIARNLQLAIRSEFEVPASDRERIVGGIALIFEEFSMFGFCRFERLRQDKSIPASVNG